MTDYLYEAGRGDFVITALASEVLSAGWIVKATSTVDGVSSLGLTSLAKGDIAVMAQNAAGDDELVVGIALETVSSGSYVSVATEGMYIMRTSGAVASGVAVEGGESDPAEVATIEAPSGSRMIGRCLIGTGGDNSYGLFLLRV